MTTLSSTSGMIRLDTSRMGEYLYADKPKLNFGQKIGRFFGKALSILGPIGAAVTAVALPGVGLPIAAGVYGLSNLAGNLTAKAEYKDSYTMQAWQKEQSQKPISTPGLFENLSDTDVQTDFMIPQNLESSVTDTILNRESAQVSNTENF